MEQPPLESELAPPPALDSELSQPPAAGMPPPLDLTPAAADLTLGLADAQPEAGRLAVELREGTLAAFDLTPAAFDLDLVSIGVDPRPCSRVHNRRLPTPVKARSIELPSVRFSSKDPIGCKPDMTRLRFWDTT